MPFLFRNLWVFYSRRKVLFNRPCHSKQNMYINFVNTPYWPRKLAMKSKSLVHIPASRYQTMSKWAGVWWTQSIVLGKVSVAIDVLLASTTNILSNRCPTVLYINKIECTILKSTRATRLSKRLYPSCVACSRQQHRLWVVVARVGVHHQRNFWSLFSLDIQEVQPDNDARLTCQTYTTRCTIIKDSHWHIVARIVGIGLTYCLHLSQTVWALNINRID